MRRAPALFLALAIVAAAQAGQASPGDEQRHRLAGESFRQAQASFSRREYAAAAAAFEQAAKFEPHPSPLLNAEEAWALAGEPVRAAEACDLVLAMPGIERRFVDEAERRLKSLSMKVSTLEVQGPRTTIVRLDGGAEIVLPARRRLPPGRHELSIVDLRSSRARAATVDLAPGEVRVIDAAAGAIDASSPASQPPSDSSREPSRGSPSRSTDRAEPGAGQARRVPLGSWIALGASAVSVGVAVGFGAATLSAKQAYAAVPAPSTADAFQRNKIITNVAWGSAAAAAVTAVVIWLVAPETGTARGARSYAPGGRGTAGRCILLLGGCPIPTARAP